MALKALIVVHKYILFGPPDVLYELKGEVSTVWLAGSMLASWQKIFGEDLSNQCVSLRED